MRAARPSSVLGWLSWVCGAAPSGGPLVGYTRRAQRMAGDLPETLSPLLAVCVVPRTWSKGGTSLTRSRGPLQWPMNPCHKRKGEDMDHSESQPTTQPNHASAEERQRTTASYCTSCADSEMLNRSCVSHRLVVTSSLRQPLKVASRSGSGRHCRSASRARGLSESRK